METQKNILIGSLIIALLLFFATAVFYKLDRFSLWQDEAETALLAKSILKNGLPIAYFDGKWVTQFDNGQESNPNHLWHITPWLPFYLCALSMKVFGVSDWAARFPFALAGFFSALALFGLAWRWSQCKAVSLWTLFFYVTNLTVIIYTRQSKYLPLYLLAYILAVLGIVTWQQKRKGLLYTILGFTILFHCNYLAAGLALAGFGTYALLFEEGRKCFPLFWKTLLGVAIFFGPFMLLAPLAERTGGHLPPLPPLLLYFKKLGTHIYYWNGQVFPLLLGILFFWKRPPYFRFLGSAVLVSWILLPFFSKDVLRYGLHLLPLFCFALGFLFFQLWKEKPKIGIFLFLLFFGTNLFQNLPDAIAFQSFKKLYYKDDWFALKNYYFKNYADPIKIIPAMVAARSKGREFVYLNHDPLVWQWYSDIPLAYLADRDKVKSKNPRPPPYWTDRNRIDWWIGPHYVRMLYSFHVGEEEIKREWAARGHSFEVIETGIPLMHWDLASPIRYKHFLDKFSEKPSIPETIRLVHRLP